MLSQLNELQTFLQKSLASCVFAAAIFLALALSHTHLPFGIARYDFLLASCILIQCAMFVVGLETRDEVLVICVFHVLGICMELFKVHMGSWSYPEWAIMKFWDVPLYSGFMYASVASFMCQAWRRFHLRLEHWPPAWAAWTISLLIYLNFFSSHVVPDLRWYLFVVVILVFWRSRIYLTLTTERSMPVSASFLLIGVVIWVAENMATRLGAWQYAYQHGGWQMVSVHKVGSWTLMSIVSYIIVAQLKIVKSSMVRPHATNHDGARDEAFVSEPNSSSYSVKTNRGVREYTQNHQKQYNE